MPNWLGQALTLLRRLWHVLQDVLYLLRQSFDSADRRSGGLLRRLVHAWTVFNRRDTRLAASIAYYGLFSIFPIILLSVSLISSLVGPAIAEERVLDIAQSFLPGDTLALIQENIQLALGQQQGLNIVAAIGLLWSALSLFTNLSYALDTIFVPERVRPLWRQRLIALGMAIALALLLLVSLITSATFRLIGILLLDRTSTFLTIGAVFLPIGLNVTIFALLYRYLPRVHVRWDAVWPAALIGGAVWELLKGLFVWFIENLTSFNVLFGSLGTVIVLLIWTYLTASLVLLGAEFCHATNDWLNTRANQRAAE